MPLHEGALYTLGILSSATTEVSIGKAEYRVQPEKDNIVAQVACLQGVSTTTSTEKHRPCYSE